MVLPDWTHPPRESVQAQAKSTLFSQASPMDRQMGRPLDRLAAAIVDVFVILAPAYILVSAPLKRWLTKSYVLGSEPDFALTIALMTVLAAFLLIAYQTIALFFFATTVGKRLFDLKVVPMFGERLTLWDYGIRSLVWTFELSLFGLPWLAVFSNARRRPLHDRICDTIVVTRHLSGVSSPLSWERALVRGLFAAVIGLGTLSVAIQMQGVVEKLRTDDSFASLMAKDAGQCEAVTGQLEEGGEAIDGDDHARLKTAMILYAAGLVDTDCLESEVERQVAMQVAVGPLTYLAQAFIYADDAEISNSYLDEVCEIAGDTVECAMSRLVGAWSEAQWPSVENILRTAAPGSGYLEVWGVRHYMKQAKYNDAMDLLDKLVNRPELRDFTLVQRVKALYSLAMGSIAEVAYQQAFVALPLDDGKSLSAWVCAQDLQYGCQALDGMACRQMDRMGDGVDSVDVKFANEALARVLSMECSSKVDYLKLSDATANDKTWQMFFRANLKHQREDRTAAFELFMKVIESPQTPEVLRVEAARRAMKFATYKQMEKLVELWNNLDSRETWVRMGNMLFPHLSEQRSPLALDVGRDLLSGQAMWPKSLAVFRSTGDSLPEHERKPASVKVKESVKQLLDAVEEAQ